MFWLSSSEQLNHILIFAARMYCYLCKEVLPRLKLIWGDSHYGGILRIWVKITLGWAIKVLIVPKRTFSWLTRWRLCRNHKELSKSSEALITLAASYSCLNILAPAHFSYEREANTN